MKKKVVFFTKKSPTRPIKYKRMNLAPCNKSIMATQLLSTNLELSLSGINSRLRVNSAKNIARLFPNWRKWQLLNPRNFTKNDHR